MLSYADVGTALLTSASTETSVANRLRLRGLFGVPESWSAPALLTENSYTESCDDQYYNR